MVSLPQLVKGRLRQQLRLDPHPDPNQLTALIESCLPEAERARVLKHMASCEECREVVFLSLPEMESSQLTLAKTHVEWLRWPALRWGAVAACALVVGAAVTLHRESPRFQTAPLVAVTSDRDALPEKVSPASEQSNLSKQNNKPDAQPTGNNFAKDRAANPHSATQNLPSAVTIQSSSSAAAKITEPSRVAGSDMSTLGASTRADGLQGLPEEQDRRVEKRDEVPGVVGRNVPSSPAAANAELATGKAKEPLSKDEVAAEAKKSLPMQGASATGGLVLAPRWTLSADGTLQRSFNAGTTWETIPLGANSHLRALAAVGNEIWVGGSAGSLYHSSDAGNHWTQVRATVAGRALTSDIIGVEFTDTQHGKLTLADGESWSTTDGGQSWSTK